MVGSGGGIYASESSLSLSGTEISGNSATGLRPIGGGIALEGEGAYALLDHVTVEQNTATVTGGTGYAAGGGVSAIEVAGSR